MRSENHQIENYRDQLKQLEKELEMSEQNRKMFFRLCERWTTESQDIKIALIRLQKKINQIEEMKRHPH